MKLFEPESIDKHLISLMSPERKEGIDPEIYRDRVSLLTAIVYITHFN